jgi:predicted nucleotidyltransferase
MADAKASNLERIISILKDHKAELREKYRVKEIGIFGSYVREEYKEKSDLDILVEFEEDAKIGLLKFINLENYLSELIAVKVDLVEKSSLKPRIGKNILREVITL